SSAVFAAGPYSYLPISHTPYLLALGWLMLFVRGKRWADVGFRWPEHAGSGIVLGLLGGIALSVPELVRLEPGVSWVLAAFGEEMVWRGYAMNRVAEMFGGTTGAWIASAVLVSTVFGIAHDY